MIISEFVHCTKIDWRKWLEEEKGIKTRNKIKKNLFQELELFVLAIFLGTKPSELNNTV